MNPRPYSLRRLESMEEVVKRNECDLAIFHMSLLGEAFYGNLGPHNNPYRKQVELPKEQKDLRRQKDLENGYKFLGKFLARL